MSGEASQFLRFCMVGAGVTVLYVINYPLLINAGLNPFLANFLAYVISIAVQFVGQTVWAFRKPLSDGAQNTRFFVTVGFGLFFSSIVAGQVGPGLGWQPLITAGVVAVSVPVLNFLLFRLWVFGAAVSGDGH